MKHIIASLVLASFFAPIVAFGAVNFTDTGTSHLGILRTTLLDPAASGDFTVGMWIWPRSYSAALASYPFSNIDPGTGGWAIRLENSACVACLRLVVNAGTTINSNASVLVLKRWQYIAISFVGSTKTATFYVNGVPQGSAVDSAVPTASATASMLGNDFATDRPYDGYISGLMIWQRALTPQEVRGQTFQLMPLSFNRLSAWFPLLNSSSVSQPSWTASRLMATGTPAFMVNAYASGGPPIYYW